MRLTCNSPIVSRARVVARSTRAPVDDPANRARRQLLLREEAGGRACGEQFRDLLLGARRDQDHRRFIAWLVLDEPARKLETAFLPQRDVDEDDLRSQRLDLPKRLGAMGGCCEIPKGRGAELTFRDHGRRFYAFVYVGSRSHARGDVLSLLNSLLVSARR